MTNQEIGEFGIEKVEFSGDRLAVEGRCHRGPIVVGQTFKTLSEMVVPTTPTSCGPAILRPLATVRLTVESIWAYGRQLPEISQSLTARLELSGDGIKQVHSGMALS